MVPWPLIFPWLSSTVVTFGILGGLAVLILHIHIHHLVHLSEHSKQLGGNVRRVDPHRARQSARGLNIRRYLRLRSSAARWIENLIDVDKGVWFLRSRLHARTQLRLIGQVKQVRHFLAEVPLDLLHIATPTHILLRYGVDLVLELVTCHDALAQPLDSEVPAQLDCLDTHPYAFVWCV